MTFVKIPAPAFVLVFFLGMFVLPHASARAQMVIPEAAAAPQPTDCLDTGERTAAIADKRAIPLAQAIRGVRRRPGELVSARLCRGANGLVYVLTLLPRDGKVTRAIVDAANGRIVTVR